MPSLNTTFPWTPNLHGSNTKNDEKEDLYATLFSPPTPPASPVSLPLFDTSIPSTSKPVVHSRTSSSSSDFGAFVSVSAFDDPLQSEQQAQFTQLHNLDFFEKFTNGAAKANTQNKKVLEELLQHEDDPLYWLNTTDDESFIGGAIENEEVCSGTTTPIPRTSSPNSIAPIALKTVDEMCVFLSLQMGQHHQHLTSCIAV
jgi:hypothetical protein